MKSVLLKLAKHLPISILVFTVIISIYAPFGEWANKSKYLGGTDIGLALIFGFTSLYAIFIAFCMSLFSLLLAIIYKVFNIEGVKYLMFSFLIGLTPAIYAQLFGFGRGNSRLVMLVNYIA